MATAITLNLAAGEYMDSATLTQWLKRPGDPVRAGEAVAVVETAKAASELTAPVDGILAAQAAAEGDQVPLGATIGWINAAGEAMPEAAAAAPVAPARATPAARSLARELGVNLATVLGTGPGGRIQERDIREAAAAAKGAATAALPGSSSEPEFAVVNPKGFRRVMTANMDARGAIPQFYVRRHAEAGALLEAAKAHSGEGVTLTGLLLRATTLAVLQHPRVNSHWANGEIRQFAAVNLSVAVATEHGLAAPVIHGSDRLGAAAIATALAALRERAAAARLRPGDVAGGTFTVSNLGSFGVEEFEALVTPPQVAILAVGTVDAGGRVCLTLSADHRVVDGVDAARFLATLCELLANPAALLAEGSADA